MKWRDPVGTTRHFTYVYSRCQHGGWTASPQSHTSSTYFKRRSLCLVRFSHSFRGIFEFTLQKSTNSHRWNGSSLIRFKFTSSNSISINVRVGSLRTLISKSNKRNDYRKEKTLPTQIIMFLKIFNLHFRSKSFENDLLGSGYNSKSTSSQFFIIYFVMSTRE